MPFLKWLDNHLNAFSPVEAGRLHVFLLSLAVIVAVGLVSLFLLPPRGRRLRDWTHTHRLALLGFTPLVLGAFSFVDAVFIEPRWLETTYQTVATDHLRAGEHLRIALISDLHVDGDNRLLRALPDRINAELPDLVLYAGDSLNKDAALPVFRALLQRMHARYGRYAVLGNHDVELAKHGAELFGGGVAYELQGRPVSLENGRIILCGAEWGKGVAVRNCLEESDSHALRIALYHSPDLVEAVAAGGADLFLAGHTHGGQVRLPFYGAVITMSSFDKKYEAGRYLVGDTTLYVNRGIGTEGRVFPMRFLCRPELTIIDLIGTGPAS